MVNRSWALILFLIFPAQLGFAGIARFKGYEEIDQLVRTRMLATGSMYLLTRVALPHPIYQLLGGYQSGSTVDLEFINGDPTVMNFTLWSIVFQTLAIKVADTCNNAVNAKKSFNPSIFTKVQSLCILPHGIDAAAEQTLRELWDEITLFEIPENELDAWIEFVKKAYTTRTSEKEKFMLKQAIQALFMNPYILLTPARGIPRETPKGIQ